MDRIRFSLSLSFVSSSYISVDLHACYGNFRCVEAWARIENITHHSYMILSSIAEVSAISCSNTSPSLTFENAGIDFGLNIGLLGITQLNSSACVDSHPVFAISQRTRYTAEDSSNVESFIVAPTRLLVTRSMVNLGPPINEICAADRPFLYNPAFMAGRFWIVRATVSFDDLPPRTVRHERVTYPVGYGFFLDTSSQITKIPFEDYDTLTERITRLSGSRLIQREDRRDMFENCHENLHLFPTVSFTTLVSDSIAVFRLLVFPQDYVNVDCSISIEPARANDRRVIGDNILRHFTVHFDQAQGTIGFCDPL